MHAKEIAAVALQQDQERLKVVAANLANIQTHGYKRAHAVVSPFEWHWQQQALSVIGAAPVATALDGQAGKLMPVEDGLAVALKPGHWLVLQGAEGQTLLGAAGRLTVGAEGQLRHPSGLKVLGLAGSVSVPPGAGPLRVDDAGVVWAGEQALDTLRVASAPGHLMSLVASGGYEVAGGLWDEVRAASGMFTPGTLEASNVVLADEMLQMMNVTRHAEAMSRVLQMSDDMLGQAIRRMGDAT